jgi:hypothetical protein
VEGVGDDEGLIEDGVDGGGDFIFEEVFALFFCEGEDELDFFEFFDGGGGLRGEWGWGGGGEDLFCLLSGDGASLGVGFFDGFEFCVLVLQLF